LERDAVLRAGLPGPVELRERMLRAVGAVDGFARAGDEARVALRVAYRRCLSEIVAADLAASDAVGAVADVSAALADAAAAALEAALAVARTEVAGGGPETPAGREVALARLAVIGMGKTGARELNYVSDVDVIFVGGTADEEVLAEARAVDIATRLA